MSLRLAALGLSLIALHRGARADVPVVLAPEDTETDAPAGESIVRLSAWRSHTFDRTPARANLGFLGFQVGWSMAGVKAKALGRFRGVGPGEIDHWAVRLRGGIALPSERAAWVAPLTVALRRFTPIDVLANAPLLHAQAGVEVAVSAPSLDGPDHPGPVVRDAFGSESELVERGWSVRPFSPHLRVDVLACRSLLVEVGLEPELFRSIAEPDRALAYGLRWHAVAGASLACNHLRREGLNDVTVAVEYRARAVLHRGDEDPGYEGLWTVGVAYHPGPYTIGAFTRLGGFTSDAATATIGINLRASFGGVR